LPVDAITIACGRARRGAVLGHVACRKGLLSKSAYGAGVCRSGTIAFSVALVRHILSQHETRSGWQILNRSLPDQDAFDGSEDKGD
jgi:hypothetical protein